MQLVKAARKHLRVARGVQIWFTFLTQARLVSCLLLDSVCVLRRLVSPRVCYNIPEGGSWSSGSAWPAILCVMPASEESSPRLCVYYLLACIKSWL